MRFVVQKRCRRPGENVCGSQNCIFVKAVFRNSEKRNRNLMVLGCVFMHRALEMCFQNSENQSNIDGFAVARQIGTFAPCKAVKMIDVKLWQT